MKVLFLAVLLWLLACSPAYAPLIIVASGGSSTPAAEQIGDELVAGGANYFVNPLDASCSNSNNGQYPEEVSGANGPWCDNDAVEAATFDSTVDSVWIIAGSTQTGAAARLTNIELAGTQSGGVCTRLLIFGAYYMDGATARRGLGGGARPILQGSVGYWDHTLSWVGGGTSADRYPNDRYQGMVHSGTGGMSCSHWENIHIRHAGGRGFNFDSVVGVTLDNVFVEDVYDSGIHFQDSSAFEVTNSYLKGDDFGYGTGDPDFMNGWGAGIAGVDSCSGARIQGNYVWDSWGEGINCFNFGSAETADLIIEDNFLLDNRSTSIYFDGLRESIARRNVLARTGRSLYWRNPGASYRGDCISHSDEALASWNGGTSAFPSQDLVVYANIIVGCDDGVLVLQWGNVSQMSTHDNLYYYGNLFIDNLETIGAWDTALTGGRFWSNASVLFTMGAVHVNSGLGIQDADIDKNYWSSEPVAAWQDTDDVVSGCTLTKTSGWRDLEDLVTPEADGSLSAAEMLDLKAQIIAGARPASAAACDGTGVAIASRTFPANVTVDTGPADTDFDDAAYTSADIGAFGL